MMGGINYTIEPYEICIDPADVVLKKFNLNPHIFCLLKFSINFGV